MKVFTRVLIVLFLSFFTLGGIAPPAQATDNPIPIFQWVDKDGAQQACFNVDDCAQHILNDLATTTMAGGCFYEYADACHTAVRLERELWNHVVTWEDAQAAFVYYQWWYDIALRVANPTDPGLIMWRALLTTAQEAVGMAFNPDTHEYLGTPPSYYRAAVPIPDIERPTNPVSFSKTYPPTISGTAKVGKVLTAKVKSWSPKASFSYQWANNGTPIAGATKKTYKLAATDLGATITVSVTGTRSGYTATTKASTPTKVVALGSLAKGKVKVTGTRRVGRILKAKMSKWSSGVTYHYQWYRSGKKIKGATGKTYILTPADRGKKMKVKVWTTKDGYKTSSSRTSARTGKIGYGHFVAVTPVISSNAVIGETLTVNPGSWKPSETVFTYQWYKVNKKGKSYRISGATQSSYLIPAEMAGWRLKVKVTGKAPGYSSKSVTSKAVKVASLTPPPPPPDPVPPTDPNPSPSPGTTP